MSPASQKPDLWRKKMNFFGEFVKVKSKFCGAFVEYRNPIDTLSGAVPGDGEQARFRPGKPKIAI